VLHNNVPVSWLGMRKVPASAMLRFMEASVLLYLSRGPASVKQQR
jgi:hypothetical protein